MSEEKQHRRHGSGRTKNINLHEAHVQNSQKYSCLKDDGTLFMKYNDGYFKDENNLSATLSEEDISPKKSTLFPQKMFKMKGYFSQRKVVNKPDHMHSKSKSSFSLSFLNKKWFSQKKAQAEHYQSAQDTFNPEFVVSTTECEGSSTSSCPPTVNKISVIPYEECDAIQLSISTDCPESTKDRSDRSIIMSNIKHLSKCCKRHERNQFKDQTIYARDEDEDIGHKSLYYEKKSSPIEHPAPFSHSKRKSEPRNSNFMRTKAHEVLNNKLYLVEDSPPKEISYFDEDLSPSTNKYNRKHSELTRSPMSRKYELRETRDHTGPKNVTLIKSNTGKLEVVGYRDIARYHPGMCGMNSQRKNRTQRLNDIDRYMMQREKPSLRHKKQQKNNGSELFTKAFDNVVINAAPSYSVYKQREVQKENPSKALRDHFSKIGISPILLRQK